MRKSEIDWHQHNRNYESSGLSIRQYCARVGINEKTFQNRRFKIRQDSALVVPTGNQTQFVEYGIDSELRITVSNQGLVSLHDLPVESIPAILRALHAVCQ